MITPDSVFKIGYISKHRGLRGEVELCFTDDCFDTGTSEYLVLDMDGILVPFFWEEYRFKNDETAILKLEDVDNEAQARRLVGHGVFYPKNHLAEVEEEHHTLRSYKQLTGFTVLDPHGQVTGCVDHVDTSSANTLLTLTTPQGHEVYIPFHDDFLVAYSLRHRTLTLQLPQGLLEINSPTDE